MPRTGRRPPPAGAWSALAGGFEECAVRPLAPTVALVTARFVLFQGGRTTASGPFTLVMERRPDGGKILHDHSSSD